jgi:Na+/melibiose symporter-like transporter
MSGQGTLAPFRVRSFRLQWPADLCTAWALEMETLILGWYVLVESGSVVMLTLFGALMYVGTLLSPLLGTLADRVGLARVLAGMRAAYALSAALLLGLAWAERLDPQVVLALAFAAGLVKPSDIGMRSALVGATMPPAFLVAAMGVSRTTQDSARIGGALAGAGFMATFGMVPAYLTITALYVLGGVLTLRVGGPAGHLQALRGPPNAASPWADLRDSLVHIWHLPRLRAAMLVAALVNLTAFPLSGGLLPYVARDVFGLDQQGLGLLVASYAGGALAGSLAMSQLGSRVRPGRLMLGSTALWYLCLAGFALPIGLATATALLAAAGAMQSLSMISLSIVLLRGAEERYRGRVMGVRMMAIYTLPLGLLAAGPLIPSIGFHALAAAYTAVGLALLGLIAHRWRGELWPRQAPANRP